MYTGHETHLCIATLIQFSKTLEYYGAFEGIIYFGKFELSDKITYIRDD